MPAVDKLRAMRTFAAIADRGSLTAAAEALESSLPAVVRQLAALEAALGTRLLNRTTRRLSLTDEGRDYLERSRRILAEVEEAEAALSARQQRPSGRIAVTAPTLFGRLHVAPLVTQFIAEHGEVRAELLLVDRNVDLLEEGLDLAVRIGELADSSLVAARCGETRRVVCASPAYLRRSSTPRAPQDLRSHACIRFSGLARAPEWEFVNGGRAIRVPVQGPLVTNQGDTAIEACLRGLGLGAFLCYQVREALDCGALRVVLDEFEPPASPIHLLYPHARLVPFRVRSFIDWFRPRLAERLRSKKGSRRKSLAARRRLP